MITKDWSNIDQDMKEQYSFWIADLSNGETAIQDDCIIDTDDSWIRLRQYCIDNNLFIEKLVVKFRSHTERAFKNEDGIDGIFFCRSILGGLFTNKNYHGYIIGIVNNKNIERNKWQIPEVIMTEYEPTTIDDVDERCILWKNTK